MTPAQLLAALGEAAYGPAWRRQLARSMDVAPATIDRVVQSGRMRRFVRDRFRMWCRREHAALAHRAARLVELASTGAALPDNPTTEDDA
ncbi:hypothetical protein [Lichenibacterium dinghuense]|uniref:hypothetical protein n=1 Tax=Lichenibacterium dinghuense TaxID=2895977 RepID=UPI001F2F3E6C|nr:hypothetical protein [Lichenibacterium sp. 6Y81]